MPENAFRLNLNYLLFFFNFLGGLPLDTPTGLMLRFLLSALFAVCDDSSVPPFSKSPDYQCANHALWYIVFFFRNHSAKSLELPLDSLKPLQSTTNKARKVLDNFQNG